MDCCCKPVKLFSLQLCSDDVWREQIILSIRPFYWLWKWTYVSYFVYMLGFSIASKQKSETSCLSYNFLSFLIQNGFHHYHIIMWRIRIMLMCVVHANLLTLIRRLFLLHNSTLLELYEINIPSSVSEYILKYWVSSAL